MSLRATVAAPFAARGVDAIEESEFVVALSLDRDWFSPDQAERLADLATSEGLLERTDAGLAPTFDLADVEVPDGFTPSEDVLRQRSTFERILASVVATGVEKRAAVAEVNALQADLGVTLEAAAVAYARAEGVDVTDAAARARQDL